MAIIIDLTDRFQKPPTAQVDTTPAAAAPVEPVPVRNPADAIRLQEHAFDACRHRSVVVDAKQRTVKCGECGIWLDPVWCLEQFYNWNRNLDHRLQAIKEAEDRQRAREKKRDDRKARSPTHLRARRSDELERAAYNEYRARQLVLIAERQRARATKIDEELGESVTADVEAAAARTRLKDSNG